MLTINLDGAKLLLDFLARTALGEMPAQAGLEEVFARNQFFIDFYTGWKGITREMLVDTMCRFNQPGFEPPSPVLRALAQGFRRAVEEQERMQSNLQVLANLTPQKIVDCVLDHSPRHTPLQTVIHITIDGFNGGFQYQSQVGWSLLGDITHPEQLEAGIAHELHHIGFAFWAEQDPVRQAWLKEKSGRAVAVRHVQNLLSEGLAMFYCSPGMLQEEKVPADYAQKLARYRQEESLWFAQAENVLALSLKEDADFDQCQQALQTVAIDFEGHLPVAHYLGARMIETMSQVYPREQIIACVQSLANFLPLYNQAAQAMKTYMFAQPVVEQFSQVFRVDHAPQAQGTGCASAAP